MLLHSLLYLITDEVERGDGYGMTRFVFAIGVCDFQSNGRIFRSCLLYTSVHTPGKDFSVSMLPRETPLVEGDIVRLDGGVSIYGYLSDIGRTYAVGKTVSKRKQELFDTLLAAYDKLREVIAPGVKMCDAFNAAMDVCRKGAIPNFVRGHFGHSLSIGPTAPDNPKIAPGCEEVFEPGMVLSFEVPYYSSENGSYGFEDTLVITEDGYEQFTHLNRSLFIEK